MRGGLGERQGLPGTLSHLRHTWATLGSLYSWTSCSKQCVRSASFWEYEGREEASSERVQGKCILHA